MEIYLGTQGWSYSDWVGAFYPSGTAATDYLRHYARAFPADKLEEIATRVQRIYGFANNHYSGHSPADIRYLQIKLRLSEQHDQHQQGTLL